MKISLNPVALKNMITQKISGDLKSGDSLFFTHYPLPNFNGPLQQIQPARNVNRLRHSHIKYTLSKFGIIDFYAKMIFVSN